MAVRLPPTVPNLNHNYICIKNELFRTNSLKQHFKKVFASSSIVGTRQVAQMTNKKSMLKEFAQAYEITRMVEDAKQAVSPTDHARQSKRSDIVIERESRGNLCSDCRDKIIVQWMWVGLRCSSCAHGKRKWLKVIPITSGVVFIGKGKLRELRGNMTQAIFAAKLHTTQPQIAGYEKRDKIPARWARALGIGTSHTKWQVISHQTDIAQINRILIEKTRTSLANILEGKQYLTSIDLDMLSDRGFTVECDIENTL